MKLKVLILTSLCLAVSGPAQGESPLFLQAWESLNSRLKQGAASDWTEEQSRDFVSIFEEKDAVDLHEAGFRSRHQAAGEALRSVPANHPLKRFYFGEYAKAVGDKLPVFLRKFDAYSPNELQSVADQYPLLPVAKLALNRLADYQIENGLWSQAADTLKAIHRDFGLGPQERVQLSRVYAMLGNRESAKLLLSDNDSDAVPFPPRNPVLKPDSCISLPKGVVAGSVRTIRSDRKAGALVLLTDGGEMHTYWRNQPERGWVEVRADGKAPRVRQLSADGRLALIQLSEDTSKEFEFALTHLDYSEPGVVTSRRTVSAVNPDGRPTDFWFLSPELILYRGATDKNVIWHTSVSGRYLRFFEFPVGAIRLNALGTPESTLISLSPVLKMKAPISDLGSSPDSPFSFLLEHNTLLNKLDWATGLSTCVNCKHPVPNFYRMASSEDGSRIAFADISGVVSVLDTNTGDIQATYRLAATDGQVNSMQLSFNGKVLALTTQKGGLKTRGFPSQVFNFDSEPLAVHRVLLSTLQDVVLTLDDTKNQVCVWPILNQVNAGEWEDSTSQDSARIPKHLPETPRGSFSPAASTKLNPAKIRLQSEE